MNKKPLISIVICTHNRAASLKKYILRSLLELNYSHYEIIFVDDASTDKTQAILREFKDKTQNVKIIKNKRMKGLCHVRNLGIKYSKGNIIAFTDDDCVLDTNWLKEIAKSFEDKECAVVGGPSYKSETKELFNEF